MQTCERSRETADLIGNDTEAESAVTVEVLIGVHQKLIDLRRETLDHPLHHRLAAQHLETFVDAAHAPSLAPGEYQTGDCTALARGAHASIVALIGFEKRWRPVNSR